MKQVSLGENHAYFVGGKTAIGISRAKNGEQTFDQDRVGLHHICFRARSRPDVNEAHRKLLEIGATIVRPPSEGPWGPGYYSFLFEDPNGIRLELNHVPGKGLFEKGASFDPSDDYT